jgi:hypothetical protein
LAQNVHAGGGGMVRAKKSTLLHLSGGQGTVTIASTCRRYFPWFFGPCAANTVLHERQSHFYKRLMASVTEKGIDRPVYLPRIDLPDAMKSVFTLLPDEEAFGVFQSKDVYLIKQFMPLKVLLRNNYFIVHVMRFLTCGFRPLEAVATIVLTTHRVVGFVYQDNGCHMVECLRPAKMFDVSFWAPISFLTGGSLSGSLNAEESCASRMCGNCKCCRWERAFCRVRGPLVTGAHRYDTRGDGVVLLSLFLSLFLPLFLSLFLCRAGR